MAEGTRVVAHMRDGTILKGTTIDFFPNRPTFHLHPVGGGERLEIRSAKMKALFWVKTFDGDKGRRDVRGFLEALPETAHGRKIAVHFRDGELLCGHSLSYLPERPGFFIFPADAGGNNLRIYVVTASALEIKAGPGADALVQKIIAERSA